MFDSNVAPPSSPTVGISDTRTSYSPVKATVVAKVLRDQVLESLEVNHTTVTAPLFLGSVLQVCEHQAVIVEVEAYGGKDDPGSHAFLGKNNKNATLFKRPGLAYVYISYGCHFMLNVVAKPEGEGSGILIRAAMPVTATDLLYSRRVKAVHDRGLLSGPGKLTQALGITKEYDGANLFDPSSPIQILFGQEQVEPLISRRIGIAIGKGEKLEWRYVHPELRKWASR